MNKRYILIDEETGEKASITLEPDKLAVLDQHVEHMIEFEKTGGWEPLGWTRLQVLAVVAVRYGIGKLREEYETPAAGTAGESE